MEGEVDDDDEGTVETDEGTQDEGEQAVTETEQVIIFINWWQSSSISMSV